MQLNLRQFPEHDLFERALSLAITNRQPVTTSASFLQYNLFASTQTNEPDVLFAGNTLWYVLTSPLNGNVEIQVNPLQGQYAKPLGTPYLSVYKGTNLAALTFLGDNRVVNTNIGLNPYIFLNPFVFTINSRDVFFLRIDAADTPGEFQITRIFHPFAGNDNLTDAYTLIPSASWYDNGTRYLYHAHGNNFNTTTEPLEPLYQQASVWYRIDSPIAGHLTVNSSTNTVWVYSSSSSSPTFQTLTPKTAPFTTVPGEVVVLAVGGDQNEFDLDAEITQHPSNDYFTNALALTASRQFLVYNYFAGVGEPQDPLVPGVNNSLWWSVAAASNGTFSVRELSGPYNPTNWMLLDHQTQSPIPPDSLSAMTETFPVAAGKTYDFWLGASAGEVGAGTLALGLDSYPTNSDFNTPQFMTDYTSDLYSNGEIRTYTASGQDNGTAKPGDPLGHSVWYLWNAPGAGYLTVALSSPIPTLLVATGADMTQLTPLATPALTTPGEQVVIGVGGGFDQYALQATYQLPPSNDELTNALPITLAASYRLYSTYATLNPDDGKGACDLWFTYDPHQQPGIEVFLNPATNGNPVLLEAYQRGALIASRYYTNQYEFPLQLTLVDLAPLTLRAIPLQQATDFTLQVIPLPTNDDFENRTAFTLDPVAWDVPTPFGPVSMRQYTHRVVADNRNAGLQNGEASLAPHESARLSGKSLWWEFTTPAAGTLSIVNRNRNNPLNFHVTTNSTLPATITDYIAWNAISYTFNEAQAVIFPAFPGQTFRLRVDTELGHEGTLMDFDVTQIPYPANDFIETATPVQPTLRQTLTNYLGGKYLRTITWSGAKVLGNIYGASRQKIMRFGAASLENSALSALESAGIYDTEWPAGQSIWYALNVPESRVYYLSFAGTTFSPIAALGPDPLDSLSLISDGYGYFLPQGRTYYLMVDAALTNSLTSFGLPWFSSPNYWRGLSSDLNRAAPDSVPGALNVLLESATPVNDLVCNPTQIYLQSGYAQGAQAGCGPYVSVFHGYGIEDNSSATHWEKPEIQAADTFPGGAGKTLWWWVLPNHPGQLNFDLSDSSCPVVVKVFAGSVLTNAMVFSTNRFAVPASMQPYRIGVDSLAGTQGIIAVNVSQDTAAPNNDMFANARPLVNPVTCGQLDGSTLEAGESLVGNGSIWFEWKNYSPQPETVTFTFQGNTNQGMTICEGSSLGSLVPINSSSFTANPGDTLYLRVFDNTYPPSGVVQVLMDASTNFYQGQYYLTPSTTFTESLSVQAQSVSGLPMTVYYSMDGPASTQSPIFTSQVISSSLSADFLIVFQDGPTFTTHRDYRLSPNMQLTASQTFAGSLNVSLTNAPPGSTVLYSIGDGNGNPPADPPSQPFTGLALAESAWLNVLVTVGGDVYPLTGHYTNTVSAPTCTWQDNQIILATTTPAASLTVTQGTNTVTYASSQATITPDYPALAVVASRPGWLSSALNVDLSLGYTNSLLPLALTTNSVSTNRIALTLTDPNPNSYIWYKIALPDGEAQMGRASGSLSLDAAYTFALAAFSANPSLRLCGPPTNLAFTAYLVAPGIQQQGEYVVVSNSNAQTPSTVWINDTPMGTNLSYQIAYPGEGTIYGHITSPVAVASPTSSLTISYQPYVTVSPSNALFTTNLAVNIGSAFGSRLRITLAQEGLTNQLYFASRTAQLTLDKTTTMLVQAERYNLVQAQSTNTFQGKVATPVPSVAGSGGTLSTLNPIFLATATPGAQFFYNVDNSVWAPAPQGQVFPSPGSHAYTFQATRPYWINSDLSQITVTAVQPDNSITNFVAPYWTILPGIPTLVYATNLLLHSSPLVQYYHQVSLDGANWSAYIPLSQPVANLLVYHRVVVVSGNGIDYEPQIPLQTLVSANYFDFRVDDPDPRLQVGADAADRIYFYKPVWLESYTTNVTLQAVGDLFAYSLEPVRQGNRWLIPGNLYGRTNLVLRYRFGNSGPWQTFGMQFKTLEPDRFYSLTNSAVIVQLDPNYASYPEVGAYYETNLFSQPPDLTQPLANAIPITNLLGTFEFKPPNTNVWYWLNSKFNLTNWPDINLYQNLPITPL
ncbi:MAG TPA: hypothetical protein PKI20_01075 [Verrucomicrobiota bacterium]|nr:hypothetical protein [Verrucomicrobiota bacterium]